MSPAVGVPQLVVHCENIWKEQQTIGGFGSRSEISRKEIDGGDLFVCPHVFLTGNPITIVDTWNRTTTEQLNQI